MIIPTQLRYRILHNQVDLVLSRALRARSDIVVARVTMPLAELEEGTLPLAELADAGPDTGPGPAGT